MPTTVKCTCPDCGDVATSTDKVVVRFREGTDGIEGGQYRFTCPKCGRIVLKDTAFNIISLLTASGCRIETWTPPIEIMERPLEDAHPAISLDDVIDLHFQLDTNEEEWFNRLSWKDGRDVSE